MYPYNINHDRSDQEKPLVMAQNNTTLTELLTEAIADETHDGMYYERLSELISDAGDKNIVWDIHLDEVRHRGLFSDIYRILTGNEPPEPEEMDDMPTGNLADDISKGLIGETDAMEFYYQILLALTDPDMRSILGQIITDESRHAHLMSYLFSKYK